MIDSRQLYAFVDPLDLPRATAPAPRSAEADVVLLEAGEDPRLSWRAPPEFHDDPDGAALFSGFTGELITTPPAFLTEHRGSRLVGYRTTLTADQRFLTDQSLRPEWRQPYLDHFADGGDFANEETRLQRQPGTALFSQTPDSRADHHLADSVVVLATGEPSNFGSFLFRTLPKLHAVRRYGLDRLPVLVHAPGPARQQFLALLGIHPGALVMHDPRRSYAIDHAIRPGLRNDQAFLDAESRALFADLRNRVGGADRGRRIYVSRLDYAGRGVSSRVMRNEPQLVERLRGLGFLIVEPETLSARDQVAMFAAADLVVGPAGSAMFNTVFCRPGTRVIDIESEPHWIHAHTCLFASCELRYAIFEAKADANDPRTVHRSWTVNIDALCDRIVAFDTVAHHPPVSTRPATLVQRNGTLDMASATGAFGWARDGSGAAAEIEILVDGVVVGRVRADLPRADLAELGPCAFTFDFAPPLPADSRPRVAARFADTKANLHGSPRLVQ